MSLMTVMLSKHNDNISLSKKVLFNRGDVLHPSQLQQVQPTPQPTWEPTFRGAFILFFNFPNTFPRCKSGWTTLRS